MRSFRWSDFSFRSVRSRNVRRSARRHHRPSHTPAVESLEDRLLLAGAPVGQGFNVNEADLAFIVDQIKIAEAHAATVSASNPYGTMIGTGPNQIPAGPNAELQPLGLRTIDGSSNNLVVGQEEFGAADNPFPRLTTPVYRDAENLTFDPDGPGGQAIGDPTSYAQTSGVVQDSQPRLISNLIADQTTANPAAVAAAGPGAVPDPVTGQLHIPNVAPDEGLSAPFNDVFFAFGQFFDHGLDLTTKTGSPVFMPLLPDDPLFDPTPGAPNFMLLSRATNDTGEPINKDTPFVDQQQTYGSHPSLNVFLREYENDASLKPVSTGRMNTTPGVGGMQTWTALKAQAAGLLGIQLVDQDVLNIPLLATDPYGKFLPGPNGYPQLVLDDGTLLEGNPAANGGLGVLVPANSVSSGFAFLVDIAHHAVPSTWDHDGNPATPRVPQTPDLDPGTGDDGLPGTYDDEMLGAHFIAGDGRVNENIALTAVHHVFHSEHNRLVDDIKNVLSAGDPAVLAEYQLSPGVWNGERLFQAARFVTEMEYQHLVFEEFARRISPQINVFDAYDATIDASISVEFSQAVYRFGHSMLPEELRRISSGAGVDPDDIGLIEAFLNPPAFLDGGVAGVLTPDEAAGSLFNGLASNVSNEIDPFVIEAVRNNLVGLPLDLAAINIARGRDFGIAPLNQIRRELFAATNDAALQPYTSWVDFGFNLQVPESLVNFIAAYGTHPSITGVTTVADKRAAAEDLVNGVTADSADFMNGQGAYADAGGLTTTGVDDIDMWVGGLAEQKAPFGGLLGSTMNYIFELQLENLQEGDRFYYLLRTGGMNLGVQLEGNSFSELIQRNTTAANLPAVVFDRLDLFFDAAVQGSVPGTPIVDDPSTPYDETTLLVRQSDGTVRYTGDLHVNWGGSDSAVPGEGDRIRSGIGDDTIRGNGGNDRLEGGAGNDSIIGGLGNDIITDIFGDDNIKGGDGNDAISSGQGLDLNQGGLGSDFIVAGSDPTVSFAGAGNDFILDGASAGETHGDDGDDWIEGGAQGDKVEGDSGLPILLGPDVNAPGHDVLNGNGGDDRYFGEGGDDILIAGTGLERFLGQFGFDWVTHYNDPQPADSDLAFDVFAPPLPVIDFDTFNGVEGLSGWDKNDTLRGDDLTSIDLIGTIDGTHVLDAAGIARIIGLAALLPPGTTSFAGGNIIIGGGGSDILEGRGGDDIIDGDAYLMAQLMAPDPSGPPGATQLVDSMVDLIADVFAGLIDPGDITIVRSIAMSDSGTDTAVFSGPFADYDISVNAAGVITVVHARGDGLSIDPMLNNGTDTVTNVEQLQFADQTVTVADVFYFSTLGNTTVPGTGGTPDDSDVYKWLGVGANYSRVVDATIEGLAGAADVDGLAVVAEDHFYASFIGATAVPGIGTVQDEDVVEFNAGTWSLFFDGSTQGLDTSAGLDLDAVSVVGTKLYFSTLANTTVPGVAGTADDADVYSWNGTAFAREWDASAMGLAGAADVDGLSVAGPDHLFLSFIATTTVPVLGTVQDEDVVEYNAGTWSLYFDGSSNGLGGSAGLDLDAISVPRSSDKTPPTWTAGAVTVSNETTTTVDLTWSGADDFFGVTAYNVYVDGALNQTVTGNSATVTGLGPLTAYNVTIQAVDAAMNESLDGPSTVANTVAGPTDSLFGRLDDGRLWIARSDGTAFANQLWDTRPAGINWQNTQVGDFTGDGSDDVAARDDEGDWWVWTAGTNSFTAAEWGGRWSVAVSWSDVLTGDFNGDGLTDIAGRAQSGAWYIAESTGSGFNAHAIGGWTTSVTWTDVNVGDFNNDGIDDIAGRASTGTWAILQSTGVGSNHTNMSAGSWSTAVTWSDVRVGDFDDDGNDDIIGRANTGAWYVAFSNGSGFTNKFAGAWSTAVTWHDARVGDFNRDGRTDIAARSSNGTWYVLQPTGGTGTNTTFTTYFAGAWSTATTWLNVVAGDFDGDGRTDIAGRASSGTWYVALSTGTGFATSTSWGSWSAAVTWNDVNRIHVA